MNRNVESHFSRVPTMKHMRSVFDRSHSHTTTFNAAEVVPIFVDNILPGDSVKMNLSKVVRAQTMLAPVYGNMYLDTYWFFVPNRLLWRHWKEFMGENTQSAWVPTVEYHVPTTGAPSGGFQKGTIADHMGFPINTNWAATDSNAPNSLFFRAYAMCMNDFFRDQNLTDPLVTDDSDNNTVGSNGDGLADVVKGGKCYKAAKFHDYFTSCLPQPQKNLTSVRVPMTGYLPVFAGRMHGFGLHNDSVADPNALCGVSLIPGYSGRTNEHQHHFFQTSGGQSSGSALWGSADRGAWSLGDWPKNSSGDFPSGNQMFGNLWAYAGSAINSDETVNLISAGIDINALRLSTLTQMYFEALSRSGSRYEEMIEQFFGIRNPDSRMNHPEYLGGNRIRINVHEITNTAQSEQDFLGDIGAKSVTTDSAWQFDRSFSEHGVLLGVALIRYDHSYCQGMPKKFTQKDKFDFYNPMFAEIGEQPVYTYELYANGHMNDQQVFGYQEAWASYRYSENLTTGELRPNLSGSLSHWVLTDNYAEAPTLSDGWIREDKTNVDRTLAVTSSLADQFFADFYFNAIWTRPLPMYSVPGAIGQF